MRDRSLGSTVRIYFTTHSSTGVAVAPSSAFAASDFRIYKDGSATEKTTTNGITVTSPFDSLTGAHLIEIDTSNNTGDAGFWASGSAYRVVLSTAKTVDSVNPTGICVGEFSIELQTADVRKFGGAAGTFSAGRPEVNASHAGGTAWASGAIVAGAIAAGALNGKGDWSTSGQVSGLAVNTRANLQIPIEIETPDAGSQVWKIRLHLFDVEGNMEAPDSTPTVSLTNASGTDRSSRLSVASNPSTGVYTWDYTATAGDAEEQLVWLFTVVEGGLTRTYPATSYVVEETAFRFSSSDRATLNAAATAAALAALSNKIGTPAGASVSADIAAAKVVLDAVVADTNELQTDWANGGRLDLLMDAALAAAVLARQILGNKHTVVNNGNGTYTISVRDDSDTTTVRTIVYTPATGARTAS